MIKVYTSRITYLDLSSARYLQKHLGIIAMTGTRYLGTNITFRKKGMNMEEVIGSQFDVIC